MSRSILFVLTSITVFISAIGAQAATVHRRPFQPVDLVPDASTEMHLEALRKTRFLSPFKSFSLNFDELDEVVAAGERNLDWLKYINSFRPENKKLSFTSPNSRRGTPIDKPNKYSPSIINKNFVEFSADAADEFMSVILGDKGLTKVPPVPEEEYIELGLNLDRIYQSAIRWQMYVPWMKEMEANAAWDIRGYYFTKDIPDLIAKLGSFNTLPEEEKAQLSVWLINICRNNDLTVEDCTERLNAAIKSKTKAVLRYFNRYVVQAKARYESYFVIPDFGKRKDIVWTSANPNVATVPFLEPEQALKTFMLNVEDEFKWNGWGLKLDFQPSGLDIPHIVFEAGATPNVNELGGNIITMDANTPLTEWEVGWTIRHEFGHVLGLPDCYVEFFDAKEAVMINYQLDITDLMCSRAGNMLERHYTELKKNYFKNN